MTTLIARLKAAAEKATPGPYTVKCQEPEDSGQPSIWALHGGDTSYEATICQFWSGEHDNEAMANFFALLGSNAARIVAALEAAQVLLADVQDYYPAWQAPCYATDTLRAALAALEEE